MYYYERLYILQITGQFVPLDKTHPELFKGSERKFKKPKAHHIAKDRHNRPKTEAQKTAAISRLKRKKVKSLSKLADMGIDYEYPGIVSII